MGGGKQEGAVRMCLYSQVWGSHGVRSRAALLPSGCGTDWSHVEGVMGWTVSPKVLTLVPTQNRVFKEGIKLK